MFTQSIKALINLAKYLSILFLLLIACYVIVARVALHYLPDYKLQITDYLSTQLETKISVDSIDSQWKGFDPVIKVNGLTIGSKDDFSIGLASLNFSFIQSLLHLNLKFDRILVEDFDMSLTQRPNGHWEFLHFDSNAKVNDNTLIGESSKVLLSEILAPFNGTTINVKEMQVSIFNDSGKLRTLNVPNVNVNYKDSKLFASGKLLENKGDKTLLNFSLEGYDFLSARHLKGTLFIEARSSEFFGDILSVYDWKKLSIQNVEASGRAWLSFDGLHVNSVFGDLQIRELSWKSGDQFAPPLKNLALTYLWQDDKNGDQKLSVDNLAFDWDDMKCEPLNFKAVFNPSNTNIEADKIDLNCTSNLLLSLNVLPEKLSQRLATSKPSGFMTNINIHRKKSSNPIVDDSVEPLDNQNKPEISSTFELKAMLMNVSLDAYEGTPSAKNVDGYIFADNDSGFVSFLSEDFELGFPNLFLEPWVLKRAEGLVSWSISDLDVTVQSEGLRLWREQDSLVYGDFILRLNDESTEDYLSLALGMQDILFPDAVKFVPYYAVDNGLYDWLKESLISGVVSSGIYYGYGSVETESPANSFTSSIFLRSNEGVLKFDNEWPYLQDLNANIIVQNSEVWIDSKNASIAGSLLNNVSAYLPKGEAKKANFIDISAGSLLTKELVNFWLTESPISDKTKHIAQQIDINNDVDTTIKLKVPVSQDEPQQKPHTLEYLISANIKEGDITHLPSKLHFSNVNGSLDVSSETGISSNSLKSVLFDHETSLSIQTDNRTIPVNNTFKTDQVTKLHLSGQLGLGALFDYFDSTQPKFMSGQLDYFASLTLSSDETKYPLLEIKSDLLGVNCACPEPFKKAVTDQQSLDVSLLLKPEQYYLEGLLAAPAMPKIEAELLFTDGQLSFGEFLVGDAHVKKTDIKGINIAANIDSVNLGDWIDFLQPETDSKTANVMNDKAETSNSGADLIKQIQLDISTLNAYDYLFEEASLNIIPSHNSWHILVESQDVAGNILLEDSEGQLNLAFDRLDLSNSINRQSTNTALSPIKETPVDPSSFPFMTFKANDLILEGRSIGSWQFDLEPDNSGSVFRNIKGHIKGSNISGQLTWRYQSGVQNTIATLSFNGEDVSPVFDAFNLPVLLTSSVYSADAALVWPNSPSDFSLANLSGNISLSLEDGFLKTEDEKTGVLRLFGVLNAESIKRRLKLDFSDLYKSGVGFDTFVGQASIDQGLLSLTEPLIIDGPAGKYTLNGRSDLGKKALDIDMLVELPFSQNVPLAALVLGAPQIGGLVWVADKLLGEPLSALTTSRYDITGEWDKPRVELHQAMNASKKDRTKEKGTRNVGQPEK